MAHDDSPASPTATIDLTDGYNCGAGLGPANVSRRFAFADSYQTFVVNDSWSYPLARQLLIPETVEWVMHTMANVTVGAMDRSWATLTQGGVSVYAQPCSQPTVQPSWGLRHTPRPSSTQSDRSRESPC